MNKLSLYKRGISRFQKLARRPVVEAMETRFLLTGTISTLANLDATTGSNPTAPLIFDSAGNLIGTATTGGAQSDGTIFSVNPATKVPTALASFDGTNGTSPHGGLTIEPSGNLIGLASSGGSTAYGTVFEYNTTSPAISALATLVNVNGSSPVLDGSFPEGGLTYVGDGAYFGTTAQGGANGLGTVFEFSAPGTITPVVQFDGNNGSNPKAPLTVDADGNLYGTTSSGGFPNLGTVFEISSATHTLTTLVSFTGDDGGNPLSAVIVDGNGNVYGCTSGGGINSEGTVYEIAANSNTVTTLATFDGLNTGGDPVGSLIMDPRGNLFGTTNQGGANGDGTIFEVTAGSDTLKTIATFNGVNGAGPQAGLIVDGNGNLYGTTNAGGTSNLGTVFEVTGSGYGLPASTPVFTVQPSAVAATHVISPAITIAEEDSNTEVVTGAAGTITVSLVSDTGGTLTGTLSESLVNGVATFSDLSIDTAGTYTLSATDGESATVVSQSFTIAPAEPLSALTASLVKSTLPSSVVAGASAHAKVIARITNTASTVASGRATVAIYASNADAVDSSSILLGSTSNKLKLGANAAKSLSVAIKSLPAGLNGMYTLFAKVTDAGGNVSISSLGSSITAAAPFVSFVPSIVRTTLATSATSGVATHASVQVKISNQGNVPSKGNSTIEMLFSLDGNAGDGTLIITITTAAKIKVGVSRVITVRLKKIPTIADGSHYLVVQVTDGNGGITSASSSGKYTLTAG